MFSSGRRSPQGNGDESTRRPLLDEEERGDPVIFSVDDEEEEGVIGRSTEDEPHTNSKGRSVRFQEEVRVIGPPLRSTMASREAGAKLIYFLCFDELSSSCFRIEFELDSDELDEDDLAHVLENPLDNGRRRRRNGDQTMPLLIGLVDHSTARQSLDLPLTSNGVGSAEDGYRDLEELAAKRTAGGNMLDSIANMANSILGAGEQLHVLGLYTTNVSSRAGIIGMAKELCAPSFFSFS